MKTNHSDIWLCFSSSDNLKCYNFLSLEDPAPYTFLRQAVSENWMQIWMYSCVWTYMNTLSHIQTHQIWHTISGALGTEPFLNLLAFLNPKRTAFRKNRGIFSIFLFSFSFFNQHLKLQRTDHKKQEIICLRSPYFPLYPRAIQAWICKDMYIKCSVKFSLKYRKTGHNPNAPKQRKRWIITAHASNNHYHAVTYMICM